MRDATAAFVLALALNVAAIGPAAAWGREGHIIVAGIAEQDLHPETARQVHGLLALEGKTSLIEVANWADDIRRERPETAPWHFVDIPIHPASPPLGYDPDRDCPHGDCIVAKIDEFEAVLRDRTRPDADRLEALKFLTHFLGDLTQPLHCANDNDRGGNDDKLAFGGHDTNLHRVWDVDLVRLAVSDDPLATAIRLSHKVTPDQMSSWTQGTTADWANDTYRVASSVVYGPFKEKPTKLPNAYISLAELTVIEQLEKGGVRLAAVLNSVLP